MKKHQTTRHTKGPWLIGRNDGFSCPINADHELAFDLATVHNGGNDREAIANAHLITAAPDLLEACMKVLDVAIHNKFFREQFPETVEAVKSAIAKSASPQ